MERIEYLPEDSMRVLLAQMRLIGLRKRTRTWQIGACVCCGVQVWRNGEPDFAVCSSQMRLNGLHNRAMAVTFNRRGIETQMKF